MNKLTISPRSGFTLIECTIALALGALLTVGCLKILHSNLAASQQITILAGLQENARLAIDIISRDIREAGAVRCGNNLEIANVLNTSEWWFNWNDGLLGLEGDQAFPSSAAGAVGVPVGSAPTERVSGTDAVVISSGTIGGYGYFDQHVLNTGAGHNFDDDSGSDDGEFYFVLWDPASLYDDYATNIYAKDYHYEVETGDVVLVCDAEKATVFQASVGAFITPGA